MQHGEAGPSIREGDIRSRSIERRTFLGRFGVMAGLSGVLGFALGCESTDSCDADDGDAVTSDSDSSDEPMVDSDFGDPCDSDGF